jgi:hypothetical protein
MIFDDANLNERLRILSEMGKFPIAAGDSDREIALRKKYIRDVGILITKSLASMPAFLRANRLAHPEEAQRQRMGALATAIAILINEDPHEFVKHLESQGTPWFPDNPIIN